MVNCIREAPESSLKDIHAKQQTPWPKESNQKVGTLSQLFQKSWHNSYYVACKLLNEINNKNK